MENADQSKITKLLDKPIKLSYTKKNEAEKNTKFCIGSYGIQF